MDNKNRSGPEPQPGGAAAPVRRRRVRRVLVIGFSLFTLLLAAALIAAGNYIAKIIPTTPQIGNLLDARSAQPSVVLSADGSLLATFNRGQQEWVGLDRISPNVLHALLATEDHRFYDHRGVDFVRIAGALLQTAGGDAQGGSTITQQLARNLFPEEIGRSRTIERKLREMITAMKIEQAYTKEEILETYLNSVPFLYNVIGIEMAARTYFGKPSSDLDVLESATLVGMLKGTSYYNPILNPERAQKRRNVVLGQMARHGMLSDDEVEQLAAQPLQVGLMRQPEPIGSAPHFAAYIRRQLIEWADAHDYNLYTDGLIIHTTINDALQQAATEAVERQTRALQDIADVEWGQTSDRVVSQNPTAYGALRKKVEPFSHFWRTRPDLLDAFVRETPEYRKAVAADEPPQTALAKLKADGQFMGRLRDAKTRLEAGFVAIDPDSGEVKAWVGSRDFGRDQFDHVAQAARQPGSTFKPLVYGAALERGMGPYRVYPDGQVEIPTPEGGIWRPTDMSGYSGQMMTMREGLIRSKNTITAQVMQDVGTDEVISLARAAGIQSRLKAVPSLALGTSPVTLLEMVSAYATIARIGEYREPLVIRSITDRDGKVLAEFQGKVRRAMSEETAVELIDMMRGVVQRGTGNDVRGRFKLTADIAGKTGTTQNNTDGWFILMHPNMVAGAWVGFNDQRVTMRSDHWGQGGHNASLLVGDFFRGLLKEKMINAKARFPQPKRPPPLMVQAPDEWVNSATGNPGVIPPGYGLVTGPDGGTTVIAPDGTALAARRDDLAASGGFLVGRDARAPAASSGGSRRSNGSWGGGDEPWFPDVRR